MKLIQSYILFLRKASGTIWWGCNFSGLYAEVIGPVMLLMPFAWCRAHGGPGCLAARGAVSPMAEAMG
jgi:hypothetical protein